MNKNVCLSQNSIEIGKLFKKKGFSNETRKQLFCSHKNFSDRTIIFRLRFNSYFPPDYIPPHRKFLGTPLPTTMYFVYFRQLRRGFLSRLLFHPIIFFHILKLHLIFRPTIISHVAVLSNTVFRVASTKSTLTSLVFRVPSNICCTPICKDRVKKKKRYHEHGILLCYRLMKIFNGYCLIEKIVFVLPHHHPPRRRHGSRRTWTPPIKSRFPSRFPRYRGRRDRLLYALFYYLSCIITAVRHVNALVSYRVRIFDTNLVYLPINVFFPCRGARFLPCAFVSTVKLVSSVLELLMVD